MGVTLTNLASYIATYLDNKDMVRTSLKATPKLDQLMKNRKSRGGSEWDIQIRNENSSKGTKWFSPDDTNDVVGAGATNAYTRIQPIVTGKASWSSLLEEFKYSKVQLQKYQTAGPAQLADYLNSRLEFGIDNLEEAVADGLINGTGNGFDGTLPGVSGTDASEPYGLAYQQRTYSGAPGTNTESLATNTHLNLARHLHPALVGNQFDATNSYGTTLTTTGVTLTNGNTQIPGLVSADHSGYLNWEIWYRPASTGDYTRMGREYVVADTGTAGNIATATTYVQMSQIFRGANGSYDIQFRAPFNTTDHGAAGVWTTAKLNKMFARASGFKTKNGMGSPDFLSCNNETFQAFMNYLQTLKQWTFSKDATLETEGFQHFMYNSMKVIVDPFEADGVIRMDCSKHLSLYTLKGMDNFKIDKSDLYEAPSETGVKQIVAAPVFTCQIVDASPRSSAVLTGLTV